MAPKDENCDLRLSHCQTDAMPQSSGPDQQINRVFRRSGGSGKIRPVPFCECGNHRRQPAAGLKILGGEASRGCCVPPEAEVQRDVRREIDHEGDFVDQGCLFVILAEIPATVEGVRCDVGQAIGARDRVGQVKIEVRVKPISPRQIRTFHFGEHCGIICMAEKDLGRARTAINEEDKVVWRPHSLQERAKGSSKARLPQFPDGCGNTKFCCLCGLQNDTTPVVYTTQRPRT